MNGEIPMNIGYTNLDIAADDAFARHEDAATAANRLTDRDEFIAGYRAHADDLKDGPWHDLLEVGHELLNRGPRGGRPWRSVDAVEEAGSFRFLRGPSGGLGLGWPPLLPVGVGVWRRVGAGR